MRKITMKRKNKSNENTKNSTEPEDLNNIEENSDNENSTSSNTENGNRTSRRSKTKKNESDAESDDESNKSGKSDKRSSKKKNKTGKKSKTNVAEESNGTGEKDDTKEEETYEVEAVLDQKQVKGANYFLIRWKGYGEESDTWEPESTLDCEDLVTKFLTSRKSKGKKRSSVSSAKSPSKKVKSTKEDGEGDDKDDKEGGEYEVDRIIEVRFKKNGKREFFVHWKGYQSNENTWEPEENMSCHDLIEKFMEKVNKARLMDTRELRVDRKPTKHFTLSMQQSGRRLSRRNLGKQRAHYQELD